MSTDAATDLPKRENPQGKEESRQGPAKEEVASPNEAAPSKAKEVATSGKEAASDDKKTNEQREEDSIYTSKLPNRLVVTMNPRLRARRLFYFMNRARKILRCDDTLTITGVDKAISMTCTLVELLKRQKIAQVTKIATNMNLNPNFGRYGNNVAWGQPVPTIVFHMKRDEHAGFVSDYHQRKVIEVFELHDAEHTGKLSKKDIEEMKLDELFLANKEQQEEGIKCLRGRDELNLPDFIRYCSLLIHPLLKDTVFKEKLTTLGIGLEEEAERRNAEE